MKIYLAGAIRGMPDFNVPAFDKAQAFLELLSHEVFNPIAYSRKLYGEDIYTKPSNEEGEPVGINSREVFAADLKWICEEAEAIALLPGWENSKGATAERAVGLALGLKIIELDGF